MNEEQIHSFYDSRNERPTGGQLIELPVPVLSRAEKRNITETPFDIIIEDIEQVKMSHGWECAFALADIEYDFHAETLTIVYLVDHPAQISSTSTLGRMRQFRCNVFRARLKLTETVVDCRIEADSVVPVLTKINPREWDTVYCEWVNHLKRFKRRLLLELSHLDD